MSTFTQAAISLFLSLHLSLTTLSCSAWAAPAPSPAPLKTETPPNVVFLPGKPATCSEITAHAGTVLSAGQDWLSAIQSGRKRQTEEAIVFFQARDNSLRIPGIDGRYLDPLEALGVLFHDAKALKCFDDPSWTPPDWPYPKSIASIQGTTIQLIGKKDDQSVYAEVFNGYPTDLYYCNTSIPEAELKGLGDLLKATNRLETSPKFREFVDERERLCGNAEAGVISFPGPSKKAAPKSKKP